MGGLACPLMVEKGKAIIEGGFPTSHPLKHMQKDLKLSLNMGDQLDQPLPLTASANEVFKHAKTFGLWRSRYECCLHSSSILAVMNQNSMLPAFVFIRNYSKKSTMPPYYRRSHAEQRHNDYCLNI